MIQYVISTFQRLLAKFQGVDLALLLAHTARLNCKAGPTQRKRSNRIWSCSRYKEHHCRYCMFFSLSSVGNAQNLLFGPTVKCLPSLGAQTSMDYQSRAKEIEWDWNGLFCDPKFTRSFVGVNIGFLLALYHYTIIYRTRRWRRFPKIRNL